MFASNKRNSKRLVCNNEHSISELLSVCLSVVDSQHLHGNNYEPFNSGYLVSTVSPIVFVVWLPLICLVVMLVTLPIKILHELISTELQRSVGNSRVLCAEPIP